MGGEELAKSKDAEVRQLAQKYGLERYLGTEKLAVVTALVKTWADGADDDDPLTRSTQWLETKSEIEDIMAVTALDNNSKETMYLLGSTATGQVSFEEVRTAYTDGYNTLMQQYANTLSRLNTREMTDLERLRDRFFVAMPMFGTIDEKNMVAVEAKNSLQQIEAYLVGKQSNMQVFDAKAALGERETTRSLILTQAEAGFRDGSLTPMDYQQVQDLIGRSKSLFQGQVKALRQYGNSPEALFGEMDRVLSRANDILGRQESRYALAGSFVTTPQMQALRATRARVGSTGDGLRAVAPSNLIYQATPQIQGQSVPNGPGVYPPWTGLANQFGPPPEPTVVFNKNANHMKFINPADVYRNEPMESRFSAYHKSRPVMATPPKFHPGMAGVSPAVAAKNGTMGTTLGAAADSVISRPVQIAMVFGVALGLPAVIRAMKSGKKTSDSSPIQDILNRGSPM